MDLKRTSILLGLGLICFAVVGALAAAGSESAAAEGRVAEVEKAFARSMAERDFETFRSFLAEEAVFLAGATVRRGKEEVANHWQGYFEGEQAPFSWRPETVAILESGKLALSTGPVFDREGRRVSTYTSIWRLEAPDTWKIIFDKGDRYCE